MNDIKLDPNFQITKATDGDAPIVYGLECELQDIKLEAISARGELFYDETWGWSLIDFLQAEDDELVRLEIENRIVDKMSIRENVDVSSIVVNTNFIDDAIKVEVSFNFNDSEDVYKIGVELDSVNVEVYEVD